MKFFLPLMAVLAFTMAGVGCKTTSCGHSHGDKACCGKCDGEKKCCGKCGKDEKACCGKCGKDK